MTLRTLAVGLALVAGGMYLRWAAGPVRAAYQAGRMAERIIGGQAAAEGRGQSLPAQP
jgi:hypothetical protein